MSVRPDQNGKSGRLGESAGKSAASIVPVILSGGGGSRLWPFSTSEKPKQFLPLLGNDRTLFQEAVERVRDRSRFTAPIVVASNRHAAACLHDVANEGEAARVILEPHARNTAPAVIMAAELARIEHGEDVLLLVMPSDHVIQNVDEFHQAIDRGVAAARRGSLVTFGVFPTSAETIYGYLQVGESVDGADGVNRVTRFVEKPDREAAGAMLATGDYLWNAGIFLFRAGSILEEAKRLAPEIFKAARAALAAAEREGICIKPNDQLLEQCPGTSIDYAIMEHSERLVVVPMFAEWSDLGSWDSLATLAEKSTTVGPITAVDCENCYIRSDGLRVAALGIRDLIVVASGGSLLVIPRGRSQEVKKLLSAMDSSAT